MALIVHWLMLVQLPTIVLLLSGEYAEGVVHIEIVVLADVVVIAQTP